MAIFAPALWPLTAVFCILSVVLALPFVTLAHLLRLLLVASGILPVGATATMILCLRRYDDTDLAIEVVMLRHEVAVLRR